jgi:hypothetical protein
MSTVFVVVSVFIYYNDSGEKSSYIKSFEWFLFNKYSQVVITVITGLALL